MKRSKRKSKRKIENRTQNRKKKKMKRDLKNITRMFQCHNEYGITVKKCFRSLLLLESLGTQFY